MKILLAGKASEEIIFNHKSTGAKDDLKKVTEIANQMVCEYGMSNLGFMTLDGNNKTFLSEKIQDEANRIVQDCYNETLDILRNNINDLHIVSNHLFENETMTHEELKSLITFFLLSTSSDIVVINSSKLMLPTSPLSLDLTDTVLSAASFSPTINI